MTPTIPSRMAAVQLVGHGGLDKLHYRTDVPVPAAGPGEVLIEVAAAGVNNTDINSAPWKGAAPQRVRIPPGNCRSSRKQSERVMEATTWPEALRWNRSPWAT